jgi:hypothetical protein
MPFVTGFHLLLLVEGFYPAAGSRLPYLLQTYHIGLVRDKKQEKEERASVLLLYQELGYIKQ